MTDAPVVLVLRGLGLGDLLTAVPALRALRRAYPRHRLVLAAPAWLTELLPLIGAVDELVDVSGPGPVPVRSPEVAVNLHGRGPRSTRALRALRPGRLLTHAHPHLPEVRGPAWNPEAHEVHRWCLMLQWYGIAADPADLLLAVRTPKRAGPVIVHPGAKDPARRWPPARFAWVVRELRMAGHDVVITGDQDEVGTAERVARLAHLPADRVLAGHTGLGDLAALVEDASLVLCGDTGIAHLATACRTPSVVLFGPVSPQLWGPAPDGPHVALWAGRTGDPHGEEPDAGLLRIGVEDVLTTVMDRLEVTV
ncbi:ADP-heptose:LPS heptosyltransferase [Sinosporangium album]|uniref:ADP-heptose:LPS heptosyltransferase n=1 Tax=Sinosporangium album TaxID=504805 RepID=A0A1G7U178_9ACTN|nr:glycosyltransferase family 9 protein [Sinosporangium album]SDG41167.1 ADP-heptose:LPS heptosyltransferase [Sinosporangium album]